jgi:hypothetical protein
VNKVTTPERSGRREESAASRSNDNRGGQRRPAHALRRALAVAAVVQLMGAACGTRSSPISPPPGTGEVTIDMDGEWVIADLQRLDSRLPLPTVSQVPLFPPANGEVLEIAEGQLVLLGEPLYQPTPEFPVQRYVNQSDGRVLLFHIREHHEHMPQFPDCVTHFEIVAAFGSVDDDEMLGEVLVLDYTRGHCASTEGLLEEPNGRYAMRLLRIANPAAAKASDGAGESRR